MRCAGKGFAHWEPRAVEWCSVRLWLLVMLWGVSWQSGGGRLLAGGRVVAAAGEPQVYFGEQLGACERLL